MTTNVSGCRSQLGWSLMGPTSYPMVPRHLSTYSGSGYLAYSRGKFICMIPNLIINQIIYQPSNYHITLFNCYFYFRIVSFLFVELLFFWTLKFRRCNLMTMAGYCVAWLMSVLNTHRSLLLHFKWHSYSRCYPKIRIM